MSEKEKREEIPLLYDGKSVTFEELKKKCPFSLWLYAGHPALRDEYEQHPGVFYMFS